MMLTPNEAETLYLLAAVVVPLVVGFLVVAVGPWVVWWAFGPSRGPDWTRPL